MSKFKIKIDIDVDTKQFELDHFSATVEQGIGYKKFDEIKDKYLEIINFDYLDNLKKEHTFKEVKVEFK